MSSQNKLTVWTDSTRSHYFLIPDHQELPSGEFILYNLNGKEKKVDSTALTSFEIPDLEAKAYLQAEMSQALEEAKNAFSNFLELELQTPQEVSLNPIPSSHQHPSDEELISSLFGSPPEELQNNPKAAQATFANFSNELQELLDESSSKSPNRVEAARAGVSALREKLQAQGINVGDEMDELSDKLLEAFSSSKIEDYLQKILAKLRDLADQIEQSPDAVGQKIDETIKSLKKDLFVDQEKRLEEKRKQQYRKSAQDAIAESFRSLGLPSFAGGDLKLENSQQEEDEQK
jgi:ElaB/YqjD/DUF883 family membrane-anchored ribosome-binding protein